MAQELITDVGAIEERLKAYFDEKGLKNVKELARQTGVSYNTLYPILTGKLSTSMQCDTLAQIMTAFPDLDANFIISGKSSDVHPLLSDANRALNEIKP
jgi:predicted transcriptional regulator